MLSYESQMPAAAGTRRSEKPELWSGKARWPGGFCHARPRPQRGTSPSPREVFDRTTFFFSGHRPWVYNSARFARGAPASRLIGGHIPDRSPGHAFVRIANAGCCGYTKVGKAGVVVWYGESAQRILPRPTPAPAGDKPLASRSLRPHYILLFWPTTIGLQFGTFRRWGAGIEVDWRAHPGSESGMCFRTNDDTCRLDVSGLY